MKLKLYLLLSVSCFHFAAASAEQHDTYVGLSRRPQATISGDQSAPRRAPSIISTPLLTDSFEKEGYYYFSFKLNGRTRAYKMSSEKLHDGTYFFSRDVDSAPLMVSIYGGSGTPVSMEKASVEENIPTLSSDSLKEISWSEFSESKSRN